MKDRPDRESPQKRATGAEDGARYPEEAVVDAMLESDEGDEIPPPEEDIFALPVLPREDGKPGPRR